MPTHWNRNHIRLLPGASTPSAPIITHEDVVPVANGFTFWDSWPIQRPDGTPVCLPDGSELWMALGTPTFEDPDERHRHARIHLIFRHDERWKHGGPAMPDGFAPGSREWSGSAVLWDDGRTVTLYFTAAGRRGETETSYEQRLFAADATLTIGEVPSLDGWRNLRELVHRDATHYMSTTDGPMIIGQIKAFRDPAFFRDPSDGRLYFLFAGSAANSQSAYNGVIGIARFSDADETWTLLPPIVNADGLNNELERPHVVFHAGRYYLFWSTQRHVFNPAMTGPTGLYGMVADSLFGEWRPLNGSGLVMANPDAAPAQAYSWFVLPDLSVTSFVDDWGATERDGSRRFGGTFAPFLNLSLEGDQATLQAGNLR